jgi:hypothetical protein
MEVQMTKKCLVITFLLCLSGIVFAQSLEDRLDVLDADNVKNFLQPMANVIGAGMNSGLYTSAKVLKPFRPQIRVGTALISVPSDDKTFTATSPNSDFWNDTETATIFGKSGGTWEGTNPLIPDIKLPRGINLNAMSIPNVSASLGLPGGNEVMVRFFPSYDIPNDIGKLDYWGIGWKHSLDQYLTRFFPIDLAVQGVYQRMNVADVVEINTIAANIQASKKILMITAYGGIGFETADLKVNYEYKRRDTEDPSKYEIVKESISFKGANDLKMTVGAKFSLLIFNIYADYSMANYNSVNVGIGVGF